MDDYVYKPLLFYSAISSTIQLFELQ